MSKKVTNPAEVNEIIEVDTGMPTNAELYQQAIEKGQVILKDEGSKAAAAREIYRMLQGEHRDVILKAFIEGATVTVKGSPTYFYNISRKFRKLVKTEPAPE
jgi:hypothetical protein